MTFCVAVWVWMTPLKIIEKGTYSNRILDLVLKVFFSVSTLQEDKTIMQSKSKQKNENIK